MSKKISKLKIFVKSDETNMKLKNISNCFEWEVEDYVIVGKTIKIQIKDHSNMKSSRITNTEMLKQMENKNGKV